MAQNDPPKVNALDTPSLGMADTFSKNTNLLPGKSLIFLKSDAIKNFEFKPLDHFKKSDVQYRAKVIQKICEHIWSPTRFK